MQLGGKRWEERIRVATLIKPRGNILQIHKKNNNNNKKQRKENNWNNLSPDLRYIFRQLNRIKKFHMAKELNNRRKLERDPGGKTSVRKRKLIKRWGSFDRTKESIRGWQTLSLRFISISVDVLADFGPVHQHLLNLACRQVSTNV